MSRPYASHGVVERLKSICSETCCFLFGQKTAARASRSARWAPSAPSPPDSAHASRREHAAAAARRQRREQTRRIAGLERQQQPQLGRRDGDDRRRPCPPTCTLRWPTTALVTGTRSPQIPGCFISGVTHVLRSIGTKRVWGEPGSLGTLGA